MRKIKFLDGLRRVAKARRKWAPLPRVDIVIFDTHCGAHLASIIRDYSFFSIDLRGESYHIPTLLAACVQYLLRHGTVTLQILYFQKLILKLGARICVTNQDANHIFYELDKQLPTVRFIAVQQGLKGDHSIHPFSEISGDYFAFGQAYANKLANGVAKIYICGSIKANMAHLNGKKYPRICFISGVSAHDPRLKVLRTISYAEFIYPVFYSSLREVDNFCSKREIELLIAAKAEPAAMTQEGHPAFWNEWNLYENILGRKPPLVMENSYELAGESELIVCDQSALGYEMLGRGCKVVFINLIAYYHREKSYGFGWPLELPDRGPFWTNQYDPDYIQNMLNRVWNMPAEEWKDVIAPYQEQLMHYDPGNSILLKHMDGILNSGMRST